MPEIVTKPGNSTVIRFNMFDDEQIRKTSRKGHDIAKNLKTAGIKFKRVIPANSEPSIRKQFRLAPGCVHLCIEIKIVGDDLKDKIAIDDVKSLLLGMDSYRLIDEQTYTYEATNKVYRFLILYEQNTPVAIKKTEQDE